MRYFLGGPQKSTAPVSEPLMSSAMPDGMSAVANTLSSEFSILAGGVPRGRYNDIALSSIKASSSSKLNILGLLKRKLLDISIILHRCLMKHCDYMLTMVTPSPPSPCSPARKDVTNG